MSTIKGPVNFGVWGEPVSWVIDSFLLRVSSNSKRGKRSLRGRLYKGTNPSWPNTRPKAPPPPRSGLCFSI